MCVCSYDYNACGHNVFVVMLTMRVGITCLYEYTKCVCVCKQCVRMHVRVIVCVKNLCERVRVCV